MNRCQRPSPIAGLPIAWLLLVAPVSAGDVPDPLHDDGNAQHGDSHDQQNPQQEAGHHPMYAEHDGDPDISRKLAADQRRRNEEEKQRDLGRERQDSRERIDNASRYYWWWPFRR
jgi:hypothetical protein